MRRKYYTQKLQINDRATFFSSSNFFYNIVKDLLTVQNIMDVCFPKNAEGLSPLEKKRKLKEVFYDDPGHTEVKIDFEKEYSHSHQITDKTTKNGRAIFIMNKNS